MSLFNTVLLVDLHLLPIAYLWRIRSPRTIIVALCPLIRGVQLCAKLARYFKPASPASFRSFFSPFFLVTFMPSSNLYIRYSFPLPVCPL